MVDIRAFIAISLPPMIQAQLDQVSRQLQEHLPAVSIRWVPIKNIHLTLKFLGNTTEQKLKDLIQNLNAEANRQHSFEIGLSQPGAFPSLNKPRVIWVGVTAADELKSLANAVDQLARRLGFPGEDRPFSPHLTLGRVGRQVSPGEIRLIAEAIQSVKVGSTTKFTISEIHLFRSELTPHGANYTRLFSAPFS